jgi:hypothetical protein
VLPARITAVVAGWSMLPGLALIADQPGGPGRLASHLSALAPLAALAIPSSPAAAL